MLDFSNSFCVTNYTSFPAGKNSCHFQMKFPWCIVIYLTKRCVAVNRSHWKIPTNIILLTYNWCVLRSWYCNASRVGCVIWQCFFAHSLLNDNVVCLTQVAEMREKNLDLMRTEMVGVLKNSSMAFVRELVGADPVAVFRWAILRAFFRAHFAFNEAGRRHRQFRGTVNCPWSSIRCKSLSVVAKLVLNSIQKGKHTSVCKL